MSGSYLIGGLGMYICNDFYNYYWMSWDLVIPIALHVSREGTLCRMRICGVCLGSLLAAW